MILVDLVVISSLVVSVFNYNLNRYPRYHWNTERRENGIFNQQIIPNYREGRSVIANAIKDGELYSIRNLENGLYLTAKSMSGTPGPVVSKLWQNAPSQLWETTYLSPSKGYSLKPLQNEFNSVTSQLVDNAHTYNTWEFRKVVGKKFKGWIIYRVNNEGQKICINSHGYMESVDVMKCNSVNPRQLWEFVSVD